MTLLVSRERVKGIDVTKYNVFLKISYDFTGFDTDFSQKN